MRPRSFLSELGVSSAPLVFGARWQLISNFSYCCSQSRQPEDSSMDQGPSTETKDDQIQEFVTESQVDFGCAKFPPLRYPCLY